MITRIFTSAWTIDVATPVVDIQNSMDTPDPIAMDLETIDGEQVRVYKSHVILVAEMKSLVSSPEAHEELTVDPVAQAQLDADEANRLLQIELAKDADNE